jgi:ABC-type sugar transport system permease subunit
MSSFVSPSSSSPSLENIGRAFRGTLVWYFFTVPPLLLIVLFVFWPTLQTFRQSFYRLDGTSEVFAGTYQYGRLLSGALFWGAVGNTLLLGVAFLIIIIPLSAVLASLLNQVRRGSAPLKVIYFLPQLTSSVAVAIMFNYVFQPDWGLLNAFLHLLGIDQAPLWLADPRLSFTGSRAAVTILAVWAGIGYYIIVTLVGLQSIPTELYDAAAIDGANPLQSWWYITLPSLRPTFVFLIITGLIDALSRFGDLWTLGGPGGAPARSLQSIVMLMFQTGFESGDSYLAAAIAVVFFIIVLIVTLISFRGFLAREFSKAK